MALFKLVYADQKSGDTKRYLYASETGVPAETDTKVIYSPDFTYGEGSEDKCYIYNSFTEDGKPGFKVSSSRTQIPDDADVQTVAYSNGINILTGDYFTPPVSTYTIKLGTAAKSALTGIQEFKVQGAASGTLDETIIIDNATIQHDNIEVDKNLSVLFNLTPASTHTKVGTTGIYYNTIDSFEGAVEVTGAISVTSDIYVFPKVTPLYEIVPNVSGNIVSCKLSYDTTTVELVGHPGNVYVPANTQAALQIEKDGSAMDVMAEFNSVSIELTETSGKHYGTFNVNANGTLRIQVMI